MGQVSGSQVSLRNPILHSQLELIKTETKHVIHGRCLWDDMRQAGTEQPGIGAGEEERHAPTEFGHLVAMSLRDPCDQAMQAQPSQVIGHLPWGEMFWEQAQEGCEQCPQLVIGEALRQKPKGNESTEQGLDTWIGEA